MKKLLLTSLILFATTFSLSTYAYPGHSNNTDRGEHRAQKLFTAAGVTESQQAQIKSIKESYKPQLKQIRENGKSVREQKKALDPASSSYVSQVQALFDQASANRRQAVTIKAQMKNEIANVLTAEQRAEMKALKDANRAKRKENRKNRKNKRSKRRAKRRGF